MAETDEKKTPPLPQQEAETETEVKKSTTPPPTEEGAKKLLKLRTGDGKEMELEEEVALLSLTIRDLVEAGIGGGVIPVPNVSFATFNLVLVYCRKHASHAAASSTSVASSSSVVSSPSSAPAASDASGSGSGGSELNEWDKEYINIELDILYDLVLAANYLNITGLLELCCQTVADMITGKAPEEIRKIFNIKNDFTPEQQEEIRKEHSWALD